MPEDDTNVTPLRSAAEATAEFDEATDPPEEEIAGPGWTGRAVYVGGAPPRVASSDVPPPETLPSPAAEAARDDLDEAAAELDRRVHGPVPAEVGEPTFDTSVLADGVPRVEDAQGRPLHPKGAPGPPAVVAHEAFPADAQADDDPLADNEVARRWRETARTYALNADYWRGRAEAAEVRREIAEGAHLGLQTRILRAEALAEAAESLAGTVRPLVPRLPVRQREPIYQAHGRALEALAEYRKAGHG